MPPMVFSSGRFPSLVAHGLRCAPISRSSSTMTPAALTQISAIARRITSGAAMRGIQERSGIVSRRNTIWNKVWYRPDGTPRSKKKGFKVAIGLTMFAVADLYATARLTRQARLSSTCQLQLQYLDLTQYHSVDFSVPSQALAYYKLFYRCVVNVIPENLDRFIAAVEQVPDVNNEIRTIIRTTCEDVHRICAEMYRIHAQDDVFKVQLSGDKAYFEFVLRISNCTIQVVEMLRDLVHKAENQWRMQLVEQLGKTPPTLPEDFSVIG